MSSFPVWLAIGVALTIIAFVIDRSRRAHRQPHPPASELVTQVSEETLVRARQLVTQGKVVHAVKVVREDTGMDLRNAKAVVDTLPRTPA
jgi:ribosomal protein L7/L12